MSFWLIKVFGEESPGDKTLVQKSDRQTDDWLSAAALSPWWWLHEIMKSTSKNNIIQQSNNRERLRRLVSVTYELKW